MDEQQSSSEQGSVQASQSSQGVMQTKKPTSAMAVAGLVMGIIAIFSSFIPLLNIFSFPFVILGIIFAIVGIVGTGENKKSGRPIAIVALVLSIVALLITVGMYAAAGSSSSTSSTSTNTNTTVTTTASSSNEADATHADDSAYQLSNKRFETVEEPTMVLEYNYPKVSGSLKNISGKNLSYAQIEFNFYDESGAQIGSTLTNINNLEAGGVWKYNATGFTANPASCKIAGITAY